MPQKKEARKTKKFFLSDDNRARGCRHAAADEYAVFDARLATLAILQYRERVREPEWLGYGGRSPHDGLP